MESIFQTDQNSDIHCPHCGAAIPNSDQNEEKESTERCCRQCGQWFAVLVEELAEEEATQEPLVIPVASSKEVVKSVEKRVSQLDERVWNQLGAFDHMQYSRVFKGPVSGAKEPESASNEALVGGVPEESSQPEPVRPIAAKKVYLRGEQPPEPTVFSSSVGYSEPQQSPTIIHIDTGETIERRVEDSSAQTSGKSLSQKLREAAEARRLKALGEMGVEVLDSTDLSAWTAIEHTEPVAIWKKSLLGVLISLASLQMVWINKEPLAKSAPGLVNWLQRHHGQSLLFGLPMQKKHIQIASSQMIQGAGNTVALTLSTQMSNHWPMKIPNLWVGLKDTSGQVVVQKNIKGTDWAGASVLSALSAQEYSVHLTLPQSLVGKVSGFEVQLETQGTGKK